MLGWPECECTIAIVISYKNWDRQTVKGSIFLQEDVFEDSIVDFFEIADANKDGVLEYDELYAVSWHQVS